MSVHIFGCAVSDDVGSPLKWAAVDGCSKRIVNNEGHAVGMCNIGKTLNVKHIAAGVRNSLSEKALGVGAEGRFYLLVAGIGVDEGTLYAHLGQCYSEEVVGASVDGVGRHDMVAGLADIEDGKEVGCLTAAGKHGCHSALQLCHFHGYGVIGGVSKSGVEIAAFL